ncbi:MAG: class I SAM-dependent methyltransferase [bacterium]
MSVQGDEIAAYYLNSRDEMLSFLPATYGRVLEIGCGAGVFAANYPEDAESWGVEPSSAVDLARERFSRVLRGRYDEVEDQIPDDYFDLVVCNDVIEHVPDHEVLLASLRRKLRGAGCLVASVPNLRYIKALFQLLVRKDWRYTDQGVLDRTHLRFFTARSLRRSLEEQGYVLERFAGINSALFKVRSPASFAKALGCAMLIAGSLGWQWDTQFHQLAFRARRSDGGDR